MPNLAVLIGDGISAAHIAHVKFAAGCEPLSLKLYNGAPTVSPDGFGRGKGTLYICGHGTRNDLAGHTPQSLLADLFMKGLDSTKFDTLFLFSCSTAQAVAGYNGRTFAQSFYELCQGTPAFKGVIVKAYIGVLHFEQEDGGFNRAPVITEECVILPNGSRISVAQALVELSAKSLYIPPIAL
jgi:hypothetical protein